MTGYIRTRCSRLHKKAIALRVCLESDHTQSWCDPVMMHISYFKRFRMEIDLNDLPPPEALLPGYTWIGWDESLLQTHAEVKAMCFADEIDSVVFPSLSSREGCAHLMREIRRKQGFLADATWLIAHGDTFCATVQGIRERSGLG